MFERVSNWVVAFLMLATYIVGVGLVILMMAKEVCAAEFGYSMPDGTQIRVFDRPCATDKTKMGGYLKPKTGNNIWACWVFGNDKVHIWFQDGSYLSFPWSDMHPIVDGTEFVPPKAKYPVRKRFIET